MFVSYLLQSAIPSGETPTGHRRTLSFKKNYKEILQMIQIIRTTKKNDPIGEQKAVLYWHKLRTWLSNNTVAKKLAREETRRRGASTRRRTPGAASDTPEGDGGEASTQNTPR
jgi:hypothetical protein